MTKDGFFTRRRKRKALHTAAQAKNDAAHSPAVAANLAQRIEDTSDFLSQENLEQLILKYDGEVALVVIDVQQEFCDPKQHRGNDETAAISERIQSLVPEFRRAGIPVYAVYFSRDGEKAAADVDFYKFEPDGSDTLIAKSTDSAFQSSDIQGILERDNKKLLLTCGFNRNACVLRTVLDARKAEFEVCLLDDLTGNDNYNTGQSGSISMKKAGTVIADSRSVLHSLHAPNF